MAGAPPERPANRAKVVNKRVAPARKLPRRVSAATARRSALVRTEMALQVLTELATQGNNEASRISAAKALLDCGYGKSGLASDSAGRPPILYQRIELIDGTGGGSENNDQDRTAAAPAPGV